MSKIYWLYDGKRVLTSVLMPGQATPEEVRGVALSNHLDHPCIAPDLKRETPAEFASKLRRAQVVSFGRHGFSAGSHMRIRGTMAGATIAKLIEVPEGYEPAYQMADGTIYLQRELAFDYERN
jgi:hypothetical protein